MKEKLLVFVCVIMCFTLQAQQLQPKLFGQPIDMEILQTNKGIIKCASYEYEQYQRSLLPELGTTQEFENWFAPKVEAYKRMMNNPLSAINEEVITIPVVVHILHNNKDYGIMENITDEQIFSQIQVLNEDFRRMEGTSGFNDNNVGADMKVEFCLAQRTPDGQVTNGINRINQAPPAGGYRIDLLEGSNIDDIKPLTQWNPNQYLNIWVVDQMLITFFGVPFGEVAGIAQFPQGSTLEGLEEPGLPTAVNTDGIVIGHQFFGSAAIYPSGTYKDANVRGRTTTHEVGHWLGLRHIYGDDASCDVDDYCQDTPNATSHLEDCMYRASCGVEEMKENYMNYTPETCQNVFTQDQKARIRTVLTHAPLRMNLATSPGCVPPTANMQETKMQSIQLYPNPAKEILNIGLTGSDLPDTLEIYNLTGQLMKKSNVINNSDLSIDVSSLSNGVYFIKISKKDENKILRFVKH